MSVDVKITLDWYENTANVIEQKDGHYYEIGYVWIDSATRFTYYHHLLPILEMDETKSFQSYQRAIISHQKKLKNVIQKIRTLQKEYPEISEKEIIMDDPYFIKLAISIPMLSGRSPRTSTDSAVSIQMPMNRTLIVMMNEIIEKIVPYIKTLGVDHSLELIKE